jgi:hypothetical protein
MSFKVYPSTQTNVIVKLSADSSENSNQNQVKFGISIGEKPNSLNTV